MNKTQLTNRLLDEGVPLKDWGSDVDGKIERLAREMGARRASIGRDPMGRVTCKFTIVEVDFLYQDKILIPVRLILDEGKSGDTKLVCDTLASSISVPVGQGQLPSDVALDATQKFFSLKGDYSFDNFTAYPVEVMGPMFSEGLFPGLRTIHVLYTFDWHLPALRYNPIGHCYQNGPDLVSYAWFSLEDVKKLDMTAILEA